MTAEELEQAMQSATPEPRAAQRDLRLLRPSEGLPLRRVISGPEHTPEHAAERAKRREAALLAWRGQVAELAARVDPKLLARIRATPTVCALLLGPTGCGKTTAAMLLGLLAHKPLEWLRAVELGQCERRHGLGEGEPPELVSGRRAEHLVIDDVGNERDTGPLSDILDYRYSRGKPIIVTTGLTKAGLRDHIGAAFVRRIVEQHAGFPVLVVDCHGCC